MIALALLAQTLDLATGDLTAIAEVLR